MFNLPTASDLKTRYPEFSNIQDSRLELFIEEASHRVDDSWIERDRSPAILALACHQMSLENVTQSVDTNGPSNGKNVDFNGRFLKTRKVGDTSNEWAESASKTAAANMSVTASQADYRQTPYGVKFLRLMRLNHVGARVV